MPCRRIAAALALAAIGAGPAVAAETSALVGRWHWNAAESSAAVPGEPVPRDLLLVIESAEPAQMRWTLTLTDAGGAQHKKAFNGSGDGKRIAVAGAVSGTTAAFTVTPVGFDADYVSPDGGSDRSSCALSADRRKLSCHGTESDGKGHSAPYIDVYDRQ